MKLLLSLFQLLRPKQWTKNAVCLAGAFFAGHFLEKATLIRAVAAVIAFCAAAGFVYIINDVMDRDRDRNHPKKRHRPIASGAVTVPQALCFAVLVLGVVVAIGLKLGLGFLAVIGAYIVMNLGYSLGLKHLSLVDATIVAMGFILRVYAGTVAARVPASAWLLMCTFFLALFLAFGKRRAELNTALQAASAQGGNVSATRDVLHKYRVTMLDRFCNICATLAISAYALFTVLGHPDDKSLIVTTPPVVMGIFRYLLLVERYAEGESPETILAKDWAIQLAIVIWAALYVAVLYGGLRINVQ
jgi:decaprenyl-phosphate phosphoribosyltransferase